MYISYNCSKLIMLQLCNMAEKNDVRLTVKLRSDMQSILMSQWLMDFNSLTHESGGTNRMTSDLSETVTRRSVDSVADSLQDLQAAICDKISCMRHFALKVLSDALLTSRRGNKAFPPPSPPCNVVPLFELLIENNKHPNFEWRGGGGVWILLFSVVAIFEYSVSTNLSLSHCLRHHLLIEGETDWLTEWLTD